MKRTFIALLASFLSTAAWADSPTLRVCTGSPSLKYAKTAVELGKQLNGAISFQIVYTKGSMDNLRRLSHGECDAALVQSDAYYTYSNMAPDAQLKFEDVGALYQEQVQLLCNREAGIKSFSDLKDHPDTKVAIGEAGSGTATTWYALTSKDPAYGKVASVPLSGPLALTRVIGGRDAQCLVVVSNYNTDFMKTANELGDGKLYIEPVEDSKFLSLKDDLGHPLYVSSEIPSGTFNGIQRGFFSNSVATIAVRAEFILSTDWYNAHPDSYGDLGSAVLRLGQQMGAH